MSRANDIMRVNVSLPTDEEGYLGRKCPKCTGYFKLVLGTGLEGNPDNICPYCGHKADGSKFATDDQIEYAKSVALRAFTDQLGQSLKKLEGKFPKTPSFMKIEIKVQDGNPIPISQYTERDLETKLVCTNCTLSYAIFGVFAFCPDCGEHNSLQILFSNFNVVEKLLHMSDSVQGDVYEAFLESCLSKLVSAFDGYGREICSLYTAKAANPVKAGKIRFQDIDAAQTHIQTHFGFNFASVLTPNEYDHIVRLFQKRHLFSHKLGQIDEKYIAKASDSHALNGHKITLHKSEIITLVDSIKRVAVYIDSQMKSSFGNPI